MDWPYSQTDPILLHRIFRLAYWLEVDDQEIKLINDLQHIFSCRGNRYRVLAEDELEDQLLMWHRRLKGFMPNFLVQYMHLPAARKLICEALRVKYDVDDSDAVRVLLCPLELTIDNKIREQDVKAAEALAAPDDEERPGRFFIYAMRG